MPQVGVESVGDVIQSLLQPPAGIGELRQALAADPVAHHVHAVSLDQEQLRLQIHILTDMQLHGDVGHGLVLLGLLLHVGYHQAHQGVVHALHIVGGGEYRLGIILPIVEPPGHGGVKVPGKADSVSLMAQGHQRGGDLVDMGDGAVGPRGP